jgi:hypothetical protein
MRKQTQLIAQRIEELEQKRSFHRTEIKQQIDIIHASIQPVNLINNSLDKLIHSKQLKINLVDIAIGATSGLIAKKLIVSDSNSISKDLLGDAVQLFVAKEATQHSDAIRKVEMNLIRNLFRG